MRLSAWLIGDPDALVKVAGLNESTLEGWADNSNLQLLNLTYDLQHENIVNSHQAIKTSKYLVSV